MVLLIRLIIFILIGIVIFRLIKGLLRSLNSPTKPSHHQRSEKDHRSMDPYSILGIRPDATPLEIQKAYKEQLSMYHPDKVGHLGEDIQTVAQRKTQEIMEAYRVLQKN